MSTGADRSERIIRIFSRVCSQFFGIHFDCLGESFESFAVPSSFFITIWLLSSFSVLTVLTVEPSDFLFLTSTFTTVDLAGLASVHDASLDTPGSCLISITSSLTLTTSSLTLFNLVFDETVSFFTLLTLFDTDWVEPCDIGSLARAFSYFISICFL